MSRLLTTCLWALTVLLVTATGGHGDEIIDCDTESDIVFLVDSSASIRDSNPLDDSFDNWQLIKDFIISITMRLPVEDKIRVGVLKFSNEVDTADIIKLGDYSSRADLGDKIKTLTYLGQGTNTSGAIWYMNEKDGGMFKGDRDRPLVPNYGILITDGLSNKDQDKTLPYAQIARRSHNTKIFTIGLTQYANTDELQEIASDPVSYYSYISEDFQNLNVLLDSILTKMCPEAPPPEGPCLDKRADVTFLLDSSGSIQTDGWKNLKEFVLDIINNLDLSDDKTRVAVIRYSKEDIGILISDGKSTEDVNETSIIARKLKSDGVAMFTIGLTDEINEAELINIASRPLSVYYLNTSLVSSVSILTSRVIWGVCIDQCGPDSTDPSCMRNISAYRCMNGEKPKWHKYPNHILLGHNFDRLENVITAQECQKLCYRDKKCRSIDYVRNFKQCAVSYIYKDQAKDSFVKELAADYYELICESSFSTTVHSTAPTEFPASGSPGLRKSTWRYIIFILLFSVIVYNEE
ncbi:hypothetical protein LSH36_456g04013 [Paralvinella palmiformis]|uniref:VWFA domain-containing protein n=1 Tax=Paralvinella palmiformis TaxID=53620 RepID=A0AAD9JA85_9ANNE|nr:hypothetical protein LSH36_456g04013 [Paralvinella palmiformis]